MKTLRSRFALFILALTTNLASAAQGGVNAQGEVAEGDRLNARVVKLYGERRYDEALPVARRVLELREKAFGGEDLKVAFALANLGNIYARKGDRKEAEPLFNRALAIAERRGAAITDFAADVHTQLGLMRADAGKYREGEPHLQRVLEIREKVHGAGSGRVVPALLNLADVNSLRQQPGAAHALLGRAFDLIGRQPHAKDAVTAKRLRGYYCLLVAEDREANKELIGQLFKSIRRLEETEGAAEREKEQEARAGGGMKNAEGRVLNGRAISKPQPPYPYMAKRQGVSGVVTIDILIDETGKVVEAEPYCGHPLLTEASVAAARRARFTPTTLSGAPVKVAGFIAYTFILGLP